MEFMDLKTHFYQNKYLSLITNNFFRYKICHAIFYDYNGINQIKHNLTKGKNKF